MSAPRWLPRLCLALAILTLPACDRLFDKGSKDDIIAGDKKAAGGDFRGAAALYEGALDGTEKTAEVHYKLALLYDDKLKNPLDALHHMERYMILAPAGTHLRDAKAYKKEGEAKLLTILSKGSPITQQEAVRLKNDNQILREQLTSLREQMAALRAQKSAPTVAGAKPEQVQKPLKPGVRTHTVAPGETLSMIAQKYYKNKARWKGIQDANFNGVEGGTAKIKPGMVLMVP